MVEIALCLAIIGFALVAIIGVLPAGLNVQKENREETVITQEANYFMDAIRNGARGLDQLTNNVISITNYWTVWNTNVIPWTPNGAPDTDGYTSYSADAGKTPNLRSHVTSVTPPIPDDTFPLSNGERIVALLSRPKYEYVAPGLLRSNHVVALVRALTGSASDKFPQTNVLVQELGLNYRMLAEVHAVPQPASGSAYAASFNTNLHEVRLRMSWPLLPGGRYGNGRQSFRTLAGGQYPGTETTNNHPLFFFKSSTY